MKLSPEIIIESILHDLDLRYEKEYRFCERRWRFDYCIPDLKVACELEGAVFTNHSRHTKGAGYSNDCEKYNKAALLGYTVLRYTTNQVRDNPAQVYEDLRFVKERRN